MHLFTKRAFPRFVWLVIRVGVALAAIPTLLYFVTQVIPAVFSTPPVAWAK